MLLNSFVALVQRKNISAIGSSTTEQVIHEVILIIDELGHDISVTFVKFEQQDHTYLVRKDYAPPFQKIDFVDTSIKMKNLSIS